MSSVACCETAAEGAPAAPVFFGSSDPSDAGRASRLPRHIVKQPQEARRRCPVRFEGPVRCHRSISSERRPPTTAGGRPAIRRGHRADQPAARSAVRSAQSWQADCGLSARLGPRSALVPQGGRGTAPRHGSRWVSCGTPHIPTRGRVSLESPFLRGLIFTENPGFCSAPPLRLGIALLAQFYGPIARHGANQPF